MICTINKSLIIAIYKLRDCNTFCTECSVHTCTCMVHAGMCQSDGLTVDYKCRSIYFLQDTYHVKKRLYLTIFYFIFYNHISVSCCTSKSHWISVNI